MEIHTWRISLQQEALEAFVCRAHVLWQQQPCRFPTPQHAWAFLRSAIAPDDWDVRREYTDSGTVEVATFGGEPVIILPASAGSYQRARQALQEMFETTYPRHLVDLSQRLVLDAPEMWRWS